MLTEKTELSARVFWNWGYRHISCKLLIMLKKVEFSLARNEVDRVVKLGVFVEV